MYEVDCFNLSASCQDKSIKGKKLGLQICPRPGSGPSFPWVRGEARRNWWWFLWRGQRRGTLDTPQSQLASPAPLTHLTSCHTAERGQFRVNTQWQKISFKLQIKNNTQNKCMHDSLPTGDKSVSRTDRGCHIQSRRALPVSRTCHDRVTTLSELVNSWTSRWEVSSDQWVSGRVIYRRKGSWYPRHFYQSFWFWPHDIMPEVSLS